MKWCAYLPLWGWLRFTVQRNVLAFASTKALLDLYPGLTDAEKEFASREPTKAAKAYSLSWQAESLCKRHFKTSDTNDESDACRHFVWAGLEEPEQPQAEKAMDLANNRAGLLAADELIQKNQSSEQHILQQFFQALRGASYCA